MCGRLTHAHVQILDMHGPMFLGCTVAFAQPDALKGSLVKTLRDIRPTVFFGVPRVRGVCVVWRLGEPSPGSPSIRLTFFFLLLCLLVRCER